MNTRQEFCSLKFAVGQSIEKSLTHWLSVQNLGKKERTRDFNGEIAATIRSKFPDMERQTIEITEEEITAFGVKVEHYCPSRWNAILSALRSFTDHAKVLKRKKLRFRFFVPPSRQQFAKLLEECDRLPRSHAGPVVRLLVLTGLRICEARALRWEHIGADRINILASMSKNGMARTVPFLDGTAATLESLRKVSPDRVLPVNNYRTALEKACERAGIAPLSYHCFRHMFATNCIEAGVDLPTVARWLGHSDGGALLARMYFHLLDSHSRAMAERVKVRL
jgi:integrase